MHRRHHGIRRASAGFTLIEMMAVIAIGALVLGSAVRGFRSLAKSDLRSATMHLSGAIRYLFDRASTTGKHHRLVLDLNEGRYWAEVSDDRFYIPHEAENQTDVVRREQVEEQQDEKNRQKAEERANRDVAGFGGGSYDPSKMEMGDFRPKRVRFAAFKETALKPVSMRNVKLTDVFTPRVTEPVTAGRAYIYFFPMGQTEPAMVHLSDLKGEAAYSIVVHPVTGRVRIYDHYVNPPVVDQYDDAGNRIER
ncbi:MAG TPA: prepilin-type N-terminal cleavage/methylation domain-containing protein [Polyangia bacterium]|nr:prepilin-type N-terminal cleavage/methylation domain-containing protein [Polyangia bacterium]